MRFIPDHIGEFDGLAIDDVKARCQYIEPPADFALRGDVYDNDDLHAWRRLMDWFRGAGAEPVDAMTVYLAQRMGITLDEAAELDTQYGHAHRSEFDHN